MSTDTDIVKASRIVPRKFPDDLPPDIGRFWYGDSPFLTRMLDTYTLLVPDNEKYFIRNIRKALEPIDDPELEQAAHNFFRQEGQHGMAHQRYWDNLRNQNIKIDALVNSVDWLLYKFIEPLTPLKLRLSMIACIEYINAYLGHIFLEEKLLQRAEPRMRKLFEWHFAEEIEHKTVAFNIFQAASGSYPLRMLGMLLIVPLFYTLTNLGTLWLLVQDGKALSWKVWRDAFNHLFVKDRVFFKTIPYLVSYLRPGFHPGQYEDYDLARTVITENAFAPLGTTKMQTG